MDLHQLKGWVLVSIVTASVGFVGCEAPSADSPNFKVLGIDHINGSPTDLPWMDEARSDDPNHLTLATKYVAYANGQGNPVVDVQTAKGLFAEINRLYAPCNLHFRVEEYVPVNPESVGLDYSPSSMGQLNTIRKAFEDNTKVLVINTGSWNSSGGLGADGANAWTMMPGEYPSGAVIESVVAKNAPLVAHEIGHHLNLDHVSSASNMMNPVIYDTSTSLTPRQCESVRQAALTVHRAQLRGFGEA